MAALATAAALCGAAPEQKEDTVMLDLLLNLVRQADAIVVAEIRSTAEIEAGGEKWVRAQAVVEQALRGASGRESIAIDVATAGKETPQLETGTQQVFLLRAAPGAYRLVDLARPISVPPERAGFLALFERYVAVSDSRAGEEAVKPLVLDALESPFPVLRSDAAKTGLQIASWSPDDLARLVRLVESDGPPPPLHGNDRDNVASIILANAPVVEAREFGRARLVEGDADAVYFGLTNRKQPGANEILGALLRDPKESIRITALRVAGLLREPEALAAFERERGSKLTEGESRGLAAARALAARE